LGSAAASGETRAQRAIEEALNSPLLNDNDIRGARWILININSAEGEHEFTMDEVEVIQAYLLGQAGENTDVILGLGYDNSLGDAIGITLIATGFEHKDPFVKEVAVKQEKKDDKIVMQLQMPAKMAPKPVEKEKQDYQQPALQFGIAEEERAIEEITEPAVQLTLEEEMMPRLVEMDAEAEAVKLPSKTTVDNKQEQPVYFEISSSAYQVSVVEFDVYNPVTTAFSEKPLAITSTTPQANTDSQAKEASTVLSSGGYLAKPAQIYVQDEAGTKSSKQEELPPVQIKTGEDEPLLEMQLVVKDSHEAAEEPKIDQQTQPIMMSNVEEPAPQDEAEELRRRAMERIAKLRNLSFNINAADPNNEFETVPAYLRRNMELHNSIANVESFYSNYTVNKGDEHNQAEIGTINSFLDGKKPD
jgi:cell division protein FtsZ